MGLGGGALFQVSAATAAPRRAARDKPAAAAAAAPARTSSARAAKGDTKKGKAAAGKGEKRKAVRSTSRYRGVTHHCRTGRWEAHIWEDGEPPFYPSSCQCTLRFLDDDRGWCIMAWFQASNFTWGASIVKSRRRWRTTSPPSNAASWTPSPTTRWRTTSKWGLPLAPAAQKASLAGAECEG
jgi:hypothetical protein